MYLNMSNAKLEKLNKYFSVLKKSNWKVFNKKINFFSFSNILNFLGTHVAKI